MTIQSIPMLSCGTLMMTAMAVVVLGEAVGVEVQLVVIVDRVDGVRAGLGGSLGFDPRGSSDQRHHLGDVDGLENLADLLALALGVIAVDVAIVVIVFAVRAAALGLGLRFGLRRRLRIGVRQDHVGREDDVGVARRRPALGASDVLDLTLELLSLSGQDVEVISRKETLVVVPAALEQGRLGSERLLLNQRVSVPIDGPAHVRLAKARGRVAHAVGELEALPGVGDLRLRPI